MFRVLFVILIDKYFIVFIFLFNYEFTIWGIVFLFLLFSGEIVVLLFRNI